MTFVSQWFGAGNYYYVSTAGEHARVDVDASVMGVRLFSAHPSVEKKEGGEGGKGTGVAYTPDTSTGCIDAWYPGYPRPGEGLYFCDRPRPRGSAKKPG